LEFELISDPQALARASAELSQGEFVYLDTEFDSAREGVRLSLVQASAGRAVYVIDALALGDLSPLAAALGRADVTWVLHAGLQDVALLTQRLAIARPARLFDTQVAWALVSVEHSTSLAYLKYRLLGIRGEKAHQSDDWIRRPLPKAQLAYAADDVVHLPDLHRALLEQSQRQGRSEAIFAASLEALGNAPEPAAPLALDAFRNAWQLEREGQSVLRFLVDWYNELAPGERSSAPDIKGLFAIASRRPKTLDELGALRAVPRRTVGMHGRSLVAGIQRAVARAGSLQLEPIEPPPYATRAELLAQGLLEAIRAEVCVELVLAPEIALPARLVRKMREAAVNGGRLEAAAECMTGFREPLLREAFFRAAARYADLPLG